MTLKMFFIAPLMAFFLISSCCRDERVAIHGSGAVISEQRDLTDFASVELDISADVEISGDSLYHFEISDHENLLPHIETMLKGKTLIIRYSPQDINIRNSVAVVKISMPSLQGTVINGSGNIHILSGFNDFGSMAINGSGQIETIEDFETTSLSISIDGSGKINATGLADNLETNIIGSGEINCYELTSKKARCIITGSGNTYLNVLNTLDATIVGSGNIIYMGNPSLKVTVTGSGKVSSR